MLAVPNDRSLDVRKAAVTALAGVDDARCADALRRALAGSGPKLRLRIEDALGYLTEIGTLRRQTRV